MGERDSSHAVIVARYEAHLCLAHDTSTLGRSFPDVMVRIPTRRGGVLQLVEVKSPGDEVVRRGELTEAQKLFASQWGPGCVVCVWDEGDVDAHVYRVKERFR